MSKAPWWTWLIAVLVVAIALVGGVLIGRATAPETPTPSGEATETPGPDGTATEPTASVDGEAVKPGEPGRTLYVRVYLARGDRLGVALRPIAETKAVGTAAMQQLLLGPTLAEQEYGLSSAIPVGAELLGLTISDGTARVDLSEEFAGGGGTLSMSMRLAQVTFTLTQFPSVQRVVLLMNGTEVTTFSGEGLILDHPMVRADFEDVLPAIFVEGPTPGDTVSASVRVWGTANTFEAAYLVRVEDPTGKTVALVPGMATSGMGTRGTFDMTVPFTTSTSGIGTVVVFEESAKDGSEIHVVRIPVKMLR